jgi:hypothetical protein
MGMGVLKRNPIGIERIYARAQDGALDLTFFDGYFLAFF